MSITVEDGTLVSGALSFVTVAEARTYATKRGLTLPADDAAVEVLLVNAADYLNSLEARFKGTRVSPTQALCWPRHSADLFGTTLEDTDIPALLKDAQCQLAYDASKATSGLQPTGDGREVILKTVDVLTTQWAPRGSGTVRPVLNKALDILAPLLKGGLMGQLSTLRV